MEHRHIPELELERIARRALRDLPVRCAPASLEVRVLEELARRAALPWWHRGFAQWPRAVRAIFIGICAAIGGLTVLGGARIAWTVSPGRGVERIIAIASAVADAASALVHAIPLLWIYEALVIAAVLYAVLFALGAAAYRTLYLEA
jgi:hypothetical protein